MYDSGAGIVGGRFQAEGVEQEKEPKSAPKEPIEEGGGSQEGKLGIRNTKLFKYQLVEV